MPQPYLQNGEVVAKRSNFGRHVVVNFIWNVLNIIGLFFGTMSAKTPRRQRKRERGFHNYLGGGGGGGGDDGGGGGDGRRRRGPNIHRPQPPPAPCGPGGGGG